MRLIDADALIKDVCDLRCGCMPDKCEYDYKGDKYCDMAQYIEAAPTVMDTGLTEQEEKKVNNDIRMLLKRNRIPQWKLADAMGVSEFTVCRWFRHELPPDKKRAALKAIDMIMEERKLDMEGFGNVEQRT